MDGSSRPFVDLFEKVGLYQQDACRKVIKILEPIEVNEKMRVSNCCQQIISV